MIAHGTAGAAGIGGGNGVDGFNVGSGDVVDIGIGANVTVSAVDGGNAIGQGRFGTDFGSLSNAGHLTIATGSALTIPSDAAVINSGTLIADGDVINNGTIVNTGTVVNVDNVSIHNYLLQFDPGGFGTAPADLRVFAATLEAAQLEIPVGPTRNGYTFDGWFPVTGGAFSTLADDGPLSGTTVLGEGAAGPLTQSWQAQWSIISAQTPGGDPPDSTLAATGADPRGSTAAGIAILLLLAGIVTALTARRRFR